MADHDQLITDILAVLKRAQSLAKAQAGDGGDLADDLMTARENLQSLREELGELASERDALAGKVTSLEQSLEVAPELVRHNGVYWKKGDADPWCPNCWENDHRAVHMNRTAVLAGRICECTRCSYSVNLDNVSPPKKWPS